LPPLPIFPRLLRRSIGGCRVAICIVACVVLPLWGRCWAPGAWVRRSLSVGFGHWPAVWVVRVRDWWVCGQGFRGAGE